MSSAKVEPLTSASKPFHKIIALHGLNYETHWIRGNIKERECSVFVESQLKQSSQGERVCQCGLAYADHAEGITEAGPDTLKYIPFAHSKSTPTRAFGDIDFVEYGGHFKKYVRLDVDTSPKDVVYLLTDVWELGKPRVLLSIAGGAKFFRLSKHLRDAFCQGLMRFVHTTDCMNVQNVTILMEGGPQSLMSMLSQLESGRPVVVVKGTGRATDLVTYAYENATEDHTDPNKTIRCMDESVVSTLKSMIGYEYGEKQLERSFNCITECLAYFNLITIFDVENANGHRELDVAIAHAILKAQPEVVTRFKFALIMDKLDLMEDDVYSRENWLDNGREGISLDDVEKLIRELSGDKFDVLGPYLDNPPRHMFEGEWVDDFLPVENKPYLHLFLWSVLLDRQELAKLFSTNEEGPTLSALVAQTILRSMLERTSDGQLKATIARHIEEWSLIANGVLNLAFSSNVERTQGVLLAYNYLYGFDNCMSYALRKENKDFLAQPAAQMVLNGMWRGNIKIDTPLWLIFLCVLCPFLMFPLLTFDKVVNYRDKQRMNIRKIREKEGSSTLKRKKGVSPLEKIESFFSSPVVIFLYNVLSYIAFLCLYAYILVVDFNADVSNAEIVLIVWGVSLLTEEIRQILMRPSSAYLDKVKSHYTDVWNVTDTMVIVMFFIGVILRLVPRNDDTLDAARVVLAVTFVGFFLRLLHICSIHKQLGPKMVMIGNMIVDLLYFLVILMVFVISYAVAAQSILYPNSPLSWRTARQLVSKSYWNIYGELGLEEFEDWPGHRPYYRDVSRWESMIAEAYQQQTLQQEAESAQGRVKQTNTTLEEVLHRLKELKQNSQAAEQKIKDMELKMSYLVTSDKYHAIGQDSYQKKRKSDAAITIGILSSERQNENACDQLAETSNTSETIPDKSNADRTETRVVGIASCYPGTSITRFPVPDEKIKWQEPFEDYNPETYNAVDSLPGSDAEPDLDKIWKLLDNGATETVNGKPVLEVLVVSGSGRHCLPETDASNLPDSEGGHLQLEIPDSSQNDVSPGKSLKKKLKRFQKKGVKLYDDYLNDERNTDNAWVEIVTHHFHDARGELAKYLALKNEGTNGSCWLPISQKTPVSLSDLFFIHLAAQKMVAYFQ
ncbi:TMP2L-like protein [Mya arenaria]|uniref:TMP2L-like protein n=1 Tax=Mya arenaria TaxID=6604 RepID=A0ABY7FLC9_MYAAR|nr:TMP2L-like protein [Mya arenaria]